MAKYATLSSLERFWQGIKAKLDLKVNTVEGKGLSTNDLTDELKNKYDAAEANVIESITVNGAETSITEKNVDLTIPSKTSDLTNDSNYVSSSDVSDSYYNKDTIDEKVTTINEAIAAAATGKMTISIVESVPTVETASSNVIYFVLKTSGEENNIYDEYMLIEGAIELIGSTAIDLTGYVKTTDIEEITNDDVDAIFTE